MQEPRVQAAPPTLAPGVVVGGKYRVERVLGKGGMGIVVEAKHLALDEQVALKFLLPGYAMNAEASTRFLREARTVFKLKSEHVARVMDVAVTENGSPYMVLEFLDGDDLMRVLKVRGRLPIEDAVDYVIQACDAIGEAHANGIVHRDVKPSNLFLTTGRDGSPIVKVLDFGISKIAGTPGIDALTRTSTTMGSAQYMSPEQMQSLRDVDHRTDIYALGITLYTLLSGQHPYSGASVPAVYSAILTGTPTPLRTYRPELPEHFAGVVEKAYQRDVRARYQSVAELVFALAPYAAGRSKATIDRIARLVGRPAVVAYKEEAWVAPLDAPPTDVDPNDHAKTRVLPDRLSSVGRAPGPTLQPAAVSKAPVVVIACLGALVLLLGAAAVFVRYRAMALSAEPMAAIATDPEPAPADTGSAAEMPSADPAATAAPEATGAATPSASPAASAAAAATTTPPPVTTGVTPAVTTAALPQPPPPARPLPPAGAPAARTAPKPPASAPPPRPPSTNVLDDR
jgi:eukaryotic-like serine/threonine-protein kinase